MPAATSLNTICRFTGNPFGRRTVTVNAVTYVREPSRLVTRTTLFESVVTTSNTYVPAGSETPGRANGALNVVYRRKDGHYGLIEAGASHTPLRAVGG